MPLSVASHLAGSPSAAGETDRRPPGPFLCCAASADAEVLRRWSDASDPNPSSFFQSAPWASAAADYDLRTGRTPVLIAVEAAGLPAFFLPLSIAREHGVGVARILAEPLAEYATGFGAEVGADALAEAFRRLRRQHRIDVVILRRVPDASVLGAALDRLEAIRDGANAAPYILLGPAGPLPKENGRAVAAYRDARRRRRRLQDAGGYRFEVLEAGPAAEAAVRTALSWKRKWIDERKLISRFGESAMIDTIADLYGRPELEGAVGVVSDAGEPFAVSAGFRRLDRFFAYTTAYRPDRKADGGGKVVMTEMLEWCAQRGIVCFDKGPPANPYKLEWTDRVMPVADRILPLSMLGHAYGRWFETRLKPAARSALQALPIRVRGALLGLLGSYGADTLPLL